MKRIYLLMPLTASLLFGCSSPVSDRPANHTVVAKNYKILNEHYQMNTPMLILDDMAAAVPQESLPELCQKVERGLTAVSAQKEMEEKGDPSMYPEIYILRSIESTDYCNSSW